MRALRGIVLVATLTASWLHDVGPAAATTYSVGTEAEWRDALEAASNDAGGPHVIEITADFVVTTEPPPYYYGTEDLTVDGNDHTVSGSGADTGFLWIISFPPFITIRDLTVRDFTKTGASPVDIDSRGALVERVTFLGNEAWFGGALGASRGTVRNSIFSDNRSLQNDSGGNATGGAIHGDELTIEDSLFDRNAAGDCGAISLGFSDDNRLSGNTFEGNQALQVGATSGIGGAVCMIGGSMADNVFVGNHAVGRGGAVTTLDTFIERSTFVDNTSDTGGGAVRARHLRVDSSTFDGNEAPRGSAAWAQSIASGPSSIDVTNSTFTANVSTGSGGALLRETDTDTAPTGTTRLRSVTFSGNRTSSGAADLTVDAGGVDVYGTVFADPVGGPSCSLVGPVVSSYSYATDTSCDLDGTGDVEDGPSPLLGPLADNGGTTETMAPAATSPLVDAIALDDCDRDLLVDQRGATRPGAADDTTADYGCDIGAVEIGVPRTLPPTTSTSTSTSTTSTTTPTPPVTPTTAPPPSTQPSGVARPVAVTPRFTG